MHIEEGACPVCQADLAAQHETWTCPENVNEKVPLKLLPTYPVRTWEYCCMSCTYQEIVVRNNSGLVVFHRSWKDGFDASKRGP